MSLRCGLVEDQVMFRAMVRDLLVNRCRAQVDFEVGTLAELRAKIAMIHDLELLLLDIRLPDGDGLDFLAELSAQRVATPVLLLSSSSEDFVVHRVLRSFVQGFVHKDEDPDVLVTAIQVVAAGGAFFSPRFEQKRKQLGAMTGFDKLLSPREQQLLTFLGAGYSDDEVAPLLGLSAGTVRAHRRNIMAKLDLHTAQEVQSYALQTGFTTVAKLRPPPGDSRSR